MENIPNYLIKEVVHPDYIEAASRISSKNMESLGETFIGDFILPLPFQSADSLEGDMMFTLVNHILLA